MEQWQSELSGKPSLESILQGLGGKKEFDDKLSYLLEALRKYESLSDRLNIIDKVPRANGGTEIRIKAAEEVLKEPLDGRQFSDLYGICYLGSKEKRPDGHHLVYTGEGPAPINPEHFPINLAEDLIKGMLMQCHYHVVGMFTGAIMRNKPYEVLPFSPSQELQQIVESATQEYKIVIRQNPGRNYNIKKEDDVMAAIIFEDAAYADPLKRQEVVGHLQRAVQSFKEGQITRDELAAIIRNRATGEIASAQVPQEVVATIETQQVAQKVIPAGVYEIDYVPSILERMEDINLMLNNLGNMLKTPFSLLYTNEGERAKVSLQGEATKEYFNGIAPLVQRLEVIVGIWRKDLTRGAEMMKSMYEAFGTFGQQQQ